MKKMCLAVLLPLLFAAACSKPVLKQDIPISTNPMGAQIYANGQPAGKTPATVSLERNRDHILTLVKENYRQEDVVIRRSQQKEKTYLNAISSGVNSGLFFKDPRMGVGSAMMSLSEQEKTGEAYVLSPPAVKITLMPLAGGTGDASERAGAPRTASPETRMPDQQAAAPEDASLNKKELARGLVAIGAEAAGQLHPIEKKKEVSASSKSYVKPDGTKVTEKSSTSVGVGVNPAGLINALDILFK